jgi:outer membrane protein assembly factor BamB
MLGAVWFGPAAARADGPQPGAPWPQLKRDAARTGIAPMSGPRNPALRWMYSAGSPIVSGPVVAADGTIYVGSEDSRVRAVRPDGTLSWTYVLPRPEGSTSDDSAGLPTYPLINSSSDVVVGTQNGYVVGVRPDGSEAWRLDTRDAPYSTGEPQAVRGAPGAAPTWPVLYVGTDAGILYQLDDGEYAGVRRANGAISAGAAVAPDGTLIWGGADKMLYAGLATGGDKWQVGLDGAVLATPAVGPDSTTYAGTDAGTLTAVTTQGEVRWRTSLGAGKPIRSSPALGADGMLYAGSDEGLLFALDSATGAVKWSYPTGGAITAAPTIGADGLVYLASTDGALYVVGRDGRLVTKFQADGPIDGASPAIGADGTLYLATRSGTVYALVEGAPTPPVPAAATPTPAPQAQRFPYIRCPSGRVYVLNADGSVGAYVTDPAVIGNSPILQASDPRSAALVSALCGPTR